MKVKKKNSRPDSLRSLSTREREVLMWLRCGKTSWAISVILRISERTVNFHVNNIMRKLGVINRMQAVSETSDHKIGKVECDPAGIICDCDLCRICRADD